MVLPETLLVNKKQRNIRFTSIIEALADNCNVELENEKIII